MSLLLPKLEIDMELLMSYKPLKLTLSKMYQLHQKLRKEKGTPFFLNFGTGL